MFYPVITQKTRMLPFYVTGISGNEEHGKRTLRPNGYLWHQISYCVSGEGVFCDSTGEYILTPGMGFYFAPYVPHSYYCTSDSWKIKWVTFDGRGLENIMKYSGISKTEVFRVIDGESFAGLNDKIAQVLTSHDDNMDIDASQYLYSMIKHVMQFISENKKNGDKSSEHASLGKVVDYMMRNYDRDITLKELAEIMGLTPNYLCRRFKSVYGETVFTYLKQIRLNTAVRILIDSPELQVREVAERVGMHDTSYFCKAFKEKTNFSPAAFRKMNSTDDMK